MTEKGYIGLGPEEVQKEDKVGVLLGGSVPFVLRQQEDRYTLTGECYVHELMN